MRKKKLKSIWMNVNIVQALEELKEEFNKNSAAYNHTLSDIVSNLIFEEWVKKIKNKKKDKNSVDIK